MRHHLKREMQPKDFYSFLNSHLSYFFSKREAHETFLMKPDISMKPGQALSRDLRLQKALALACSWQTGPFWVDVASPSVGDAQSATHGVMNRYPSDTVLCAEVF